MTKDKNIQTRVDEDTYNHISERANELDKSISEYLRNVITNVTDVQKEEGESIRHQFLLDIAQIGGLRDSDIIHLLKNYWEQYRSNNQIQEIQKLLHDGHRDIYFIGQGSSLAAAKWTAARFREKEMNATAYTPAQAPTKLIDSDDVVVCVSRSGKTETVQRLCKETVATTVGLTSAGSELYQSSDLSMDIPSISENLEYYSKQNFIIQIIVLRELLTEGVSEFSKVRQRIRSVGSFVNEHVGEDNGRISLFEDSQFSRAAKKINQENDLGLDQIVTGEGRFGADVYEMVQKTPELLYENSSYEDPGSIRDRLLNLLYTEQAYLFGLVPRADTTAYENFIYYLFQSGNSIDGLLKFNSEPRQLRLICLTFNNKRKSFETNCIERSLYDESSIITLPYDEDDDFTNDLIIFAAIYLFTYAILDRKWELYPKVRQAVIRRVFSSGESFS